MRRGPIRGGARWTWGGAWRGRRSDCVLSAGSSRNHCAAARRLDRKAAVNMPVTGKTFRQRRADSESEEDEQDSEEVRCVYGGASSGRKGEMGLGLITGQAPC